VRIIFLDIDGVLNSELYYKSERTKPDGEVLIDPRDAWRCNDIDPLSVSYLNEIIDKTGAKVVISSTWRHLGIEKLQFILGNRGFTGEIIGLTPRGCEGCVRGNEILGWVRSNKPLIGDDYHDFNSYVILDDDSDMLYWQRNNFILVDGYVGLTPSNAYKAIRTLEGK
jgi:hypothetical protein